MITSTVLIEFKYKCPKCDEEKTVELLRGCFVHEGTAYIGTKLRCKSCQTEFVTKAMDKSNNNAWRSEANDFH